MRSSNLRLELSGTRAVFLRFRNWNPLVFFSVVYRIMTRGWGNSMPFSKATGSASVAVKNNHLFARRTIAHIYLPHCARLRLLRCRMPCDRHPEGTEGFA